MGPNTTMALYYTIPYSFTVESGIRKFRFTCTANGKRRFVPRHKGVANTFVGYLLCCCCVRIVQCIFSLVCYVIWWLHPSTTARTYPSGFRVVGGLGTRFFLPYHLKAVVFISTKGH